MPPQGDQSAVVGENLAGHEPFEIGVERFEQLWQGLLAIALADRCQPLEPVLVLLGVRRFGDAVGVGD